MQINRTRFLALKMLTNLLVKKHLEQIQIAHKLGQFYVFFTFLSNTL